ncbi:MAG TPA: hypothetical protein VFJ30_19145, partial [Phycisphaerae bacterium]|nr:hypothetical protein [Phycisphaerae bacterium]
ASRRPVNVLQWKADFPAGHRVSPKDVEMFAVQRELAEEMSRKGYLTERDMVLLSGKNVMLSRAVERAGYVNFTDVFGGFPGLAPWEAAPDGALRTHASRDQVEVDHVEYLAPGPIGSVEEFYTKHLAAGSYRLAGRIDKPDGRDGVSLAFYRDDRHHCFVTLRPADTIQDAGGEGVKIILMLRHPAGEAAR